MDKKSTYRFSTGIRFLTCFLALFFISLSVVDGFEQELLLESHTESVAEAEFDYVDFPTSLSRPSTNRVNTLERTPIIKIYLQGVKLLSSLEIETDLPQVESNYILSCFDYLLKHTLRSNAP